MALKVVRDDITRMKIEAAVNLRRAQRDDQHIAYSFDDEDLIMPRSRFRAGKVIQMTLPSSPGDEAASVRACYEKMLQEAKKQSVTNLAIPLIPTSDAEYSREEGMRIAADAVYSFLAEEEMSVSLVIPSSGKEKQESVTARNLDKLLKRMPKESDGATTVGAPPAGAVQASAASSMMGAAMSPVRKLSDSVVFRGASPLRMARKAQPTELRPESFSPDEEEAYEDFPEIASSCELSDFDFSEEHESKLEERMRHMSDTFSEYLLYLIRDKKMENADVYKRAIVDKKTFSKIKNNPEYHPQKLTVLCLCVGAKLNLDESKDLLARAGYALSPCDKTDIIFSYFIENGIYDMIELDIQLEEHGLPCIID
ncbi:MAG: hypothetical protein K5891_00220 [Lachnospiraceae bacterium]|nr:hypothetical protein [Lachnospiraceae bacterium]